MKSAKYSAEAAFFGRGKRSPAQGEGEKIARLSKETGVSVKALTLFSKISEDQSFTAEEAHKAFGHVKRKVA